MKTYPAHEIKRRGISILDDALKTGPVYVIKNNRPQYVVLTEGRFQELLNSEEALYLARVQASLKELKAGHVTQGTAQELIRELNLEN